MTDLVAGVRGDQVLVLLTADGLTLPIDRVGEGDPSPAELGQALGVAVAQPLVPATRVRDQPRLGLHLVGVESGDGPEGPALSRVEPAAPEAPHLTGNGPARAWLDLTQLHRLAHPPAVAVAIRAGLAEHRGAVPRPPLRPEWFTSRWRPSAEAWVDQALAAAGRHRSGPSTVVRLWSLSAVLEVPVAEPPGSVYLKAAAEHFRAEAPITALLGRHAPGRVPRLLAMDAERGWMLMLPFTTGSVPRRPDTAPDAARTMAELQITMVDHTAELLAAGAPLRTAAPTRAALAELVTDSVELDQLSREERGRATAMLPWLGRQLEALEATGMPATLGHGDLHTGNYVASPDGVVIFDWTDAAVTFPALDPVLLAESAGPQVGDATLAAYAQVWRASWPAADLTAAMELAPLVNLAYQALSYEGIYRSQEQRTRGEMGGVVARNLRQLGDCWLEAGRPG